jgi:hypothetical protein
MSRLWRASCALSAAAAILPQMAAAQNSTLPPITVESAPAATTARRQPAPAQSAPGATPAAGQGEPAAPATQSLTVPTVDLARRELNQSLGAVAIVPSDELRDRNVSTIKDILEYVPGVWAQPKWGEDTRLSIRGSGLSRNFHGRSLQLYMDGRHPDQHCRRLFRFPGNRSDGVSLYRGLARSKRGAIRCEFARRCDQLRDAERSRCATLRDECRRRKLWLSPYPGEFRRGGRPVRLFRHRLLSGAGRVPRPQQRQPDAGFSQLWLQDYAGHRDPLLLQRQYNRAADSGLGDQRCGAQTIPAKRRP